AWVAERWGVHYTEGGMYALLQRLRCAPKVPRPVHEKADTAAQARWKKTSLVNPPSAVRGRGDSPPVTKQVSERDRLVAVRAGATRADAAAEDAAVEAPLLAEVACVAGRAGIDDGRLG
ncbi:MAG TPA: winged helix-turn-helix domain-containing protein, partial [Solirubrobacteraceae bacterium]|nr:winged helix-turn-helix domain-containing protein [Solirubrobacteraceae bacterium]